VARGWLERPPYLGNLAACVRLDKCRASPETAA